MTRATKPIDDRSLLIPASLGFEIGSLVTKATVPTRAFIKIAHISELPGDFAPAVPNGPPCIVQVGRWQFQAGVECSAASADPITEVRGELDALGSVPVVPHLAAGRSDRRRADGQDAGRRRARRGIPSRGEGR